MMISSVTTVLSPFSDFSQVPPTKLEAACLRGSTLHAAFASYALGLWLPELADDYRPYFDSFCAWFDATVEQTLAVEEEMTCGTHRFCGHPDWIGVIKGDSFATLIDWKTGQTSMKTHRLQVAAYHHLAQKYYKVKRVLLMHPKPDGKRAKVVEHSGTLAHDFAIFLNCLSAYNFFNGGK